MKLVLLFHLYLHLLPRANDESMLLLEERASDIDFPSKQACQDHLTSWFLEEWTLYGIIDKNGRYGFYECRLEAEPVKKALNTPVPSEIPMWQI